MKWEQRRARALARSWNTAALRPQKKPYWLQSHKSYSERVNRTTNQDTFAPTLGWELRPWGGGGAGGGSGDYSPAPCHHALPRRLRGFRELRGSNRKNVSWATRIPPQKQAPWVLREIRVPWSAVPATRGSAPAIRLALAAAPSPAAREKAGANPLELRGSIALSHCPPPTPAPSSQPSPRRLGDDFSKLGKATFPGKPDGKEKGSRAREEGKRKRPGRKTRVQAGRTPGRERPEGGPALRRSGSTKARQRVVEGKARRDLRALPLRPWAMTPESDGQGPRPQAGGASSRRARARHVASVPGNRRASRCRARLCVPVGPRAGEIVRISSACSRGCTSERPARRGGKAIPNASGAEPSTHRARPGAHSELRHHGRSSREPRRARSAGDTPALRYGAPPSKTEGIKSNQEKRAHQVFQRETKPK